MSFLLSYIVSTLIPCITILIPHIFLHFHPDCRDSHADSPHGHFRPIPHIPTLILQISLIPFPQFPILLFIGSLPGLLSLRFYFRKIVTLVKKRTLHFVTTANPRHQIIVYIIYGVISVITKSYSASSKNSMICEV